MVDLKEPELKAPGIYLIGVYGFLKTGIWLITHGNDALLLEMPDLIIRKKPRPFEIIQRYLEDHGLTLKYITATHSHEDHFFSYPSFHKHFPNVPILVHRSFFPKFQIKNVINENIGNLKLNTPSMIRRKTPLYIFNNEIVQLTLSGEPLYLIHAPKHSRSDTMVIFRGTMISGDWWIGEGDPNWNKISVYIINDSIDRLIQFEKKFSYHIERIFSVHANGYFYDVDFSDIMNRTRPL